MVPPGLEEGKDDCVVVPEVEGFEILGEVPEVGPVESLLELVIAEVREVDIVLTL